MNFDIRRYLKDDAHSWAVFHAHDIKGTMTDDIMPERMPRPIVSGLTYAQAVEKTRMLNIKKFKEGR